MKLSTLLPVLGIQVVAADYVCPANLGMSDTDAIVFGYKVQQLLNSYYKSVNVSASFFDGLPMADKTGMNDKTMAENTAANIMGLSKQAMLGGEALKMLGMASMKANGGSAMMPEECDYMYPNTDNGTSFLKYAYYFEATMCGTFIGLADYVQSPEAAFLMARMSAEHGIHASALRAKMQAVGFHADSMMLTPAFTPEHVMMEGEDMEVGKLGKWLNGCSMKAPAAPCGGSVQIGNLLANLTGQSGNGNADCGNGSGGNGNGNNNMNNGDGMNGNGDGTKTSGTTGSMSPAPTGSNPPVTGGAAQLKNFVSLSVAGAAAAAFCLM